VGHVARLAATIRLLPYRYRSAACTGATSCRWETSHGFKLSSGDCAAVCPGLCARRMRCGGVGSRARCPRGGCPGRGGLGGGCRWRRALVVEGSGACHGEQNACFRLRRDRLRWRVLHGASQTVREQSGELCRIPGYAAFGEKGRAVKQFGGPGPRGRCRRAAVSVASLRRRSGPP
jgi:hypothetical protein